MKKILWCVHTHTYSSWEECGQIPIGMKQKFLPLGRFSLFSWPYVQGSSINHLLCWATSSLEPATIPVILKCPHLMWTYTLSSKIIHVSATETGWKKLFITLFLLRLNFKTKPSAKWIQSWDLWFWFTYMEYTVYGKQSQEPSRIEMTMPYQN